MTIHKGGYATKQTSNLLIFNVLNVLKNTGTNSKGA